MATPRKRPTPGFSAKVEDLEKKEEQEDLGKLLEEAADEILGEEEKVEVATAPAPAPVLEEIVPTDFPEERFAPPEEPKIEPKKVPAPEEVKPKRHPRNVPKFARLAK